MGDIDFEELDRAISAFVAKKPSKVIQSLKIDEVEMKTMPKVKAKESFVEPVTPAPEPVVLVEQTSSLVVEKLAEEEPKLSPASRRSSGRFMDVIHPTITNLKKKVETDNSGESSKEETSVSKPSLDLTESIFLADTRVEKRPLGAPQEPTSQTPRENLVAPQNNKEIEKEAVFKPISVTDKPEDLSSTLAPNIVPQYKESKPKEVQPIPIYDTNVFSKDVGGQKSGWWLVLWIIGLIVLGISSGLLTYYYILPLI